jgi:hypothetical protein
VAVGLVSVVVGTRALVFYALAAWPSQVPVWAEPQSLSNFENSWSFPPARSAPPIRNPLASLAILFLLPTNERHPVRPPFPARSEQQRGGDDGRGVAGVRGGLVLGRAVPQGGRALRLVPEVPRARAAAQRLRRPAPPTAPRRLRQLW